MNSRIFTGLLIVATLMASIALAGDVEKVEVIGQAAIVDDDKAAARDKAIDDALRKAVESAVGTMISSETITENYQLISDKIYSKAEGYVQNYKIIDEKEDGGVIIVEIKASVAVGAVTKDLDGLKTLLTRKGKPKVMVMVAEQNIGMNGPAYWWAKSGPIGMDMRTVENTLMEAMKEKGFDFVDTEILTGKKSVAMPVSKPSDKQVLRVADTTDAQIVIVGQAVAKQLGKVDPSVRFLAARAEVKVRVINADNGKVIAVAQSSGFGHQLDAKFAGNLALKNATKTLAKDLMAKIAKQWVEDTSGTNEIRVEVTGLRSISHLRKFKSILKNKVRSVKAVRGNKFENGKSELSVDLAGDTEAMAIELEAKDFGGEFKIEITKITANSLGVKILP